MSYDLGTAHGKIVLDYNGDRAVSQAEDDIDSLKRKAADGDKSMKALGKSLSALGKGVSLGATVVALTNAAASAGAMAIQIAGIIPQLASLASLSAALPGIYAAAAVSIGVMKAALSGVGDAVKAAFDTESPEKFDKALEKLAPNARAFAVALKENAPALQEVQQGIQDAFFSNGFEGLIPRLVAGLKSMQPTLQGLAADFGALANRVASFVLEQDASWKFLDTATQTFRAQLAKIMPVVEPLLTGLRAVGTVGISLMDRLGTSVANVAGRFANFLNEIAADGRLEEWIDTALQTLNELGTLIRNVFSIVNSVLQAAEASGGGLLGTLAEITGEFATFLKSAEGAEAMRSLFSGILEVARQLSPVVTTLAKALAGALGPALARIATEVGPVLLDTIEALTPAFAPLANAFADLLIAVAPLVPPIARLVSLIATALAGGISALASALGPVIEVLGGAMLEALEELAPLINEVLIQALPIAAEAGAELAKAFGPLVPAIVQFATALAQELLPHIPELMQAFQRLLPLFIEVATLMAGQLADSLVALIPHIPKLITLLLTMANVTGTMIQTGLRLVLFFLNLAKTIMGLPGQITEALTAFGTLILNAFNAAIGVVTSIGGQILNWFAALPGRIMAFLSDLPERLGNLFLTALRGAATIVGTQIGLIVGIVTKLPPRIFEALANLSKSIWDRVTAAWNGARTRFLDGVAKAVSAAATLLPRIGRALQSLPTQLSTLARNAWNRLLSAFTDGRNRAESIARSLPGRIVRVIGNLGSTLYGAGRDLIQGLVNGISSGISRVMNMVRDLAERVRNAFNNALEIFSPSRVFFESGVDIDDGLIGGIRSKLRQVQAMAVKLADSVIQPTVALPAGATGALSVGMNTQPTRTAPEQPVADTFGPYELVLDGNVVASFVVDTITGNPATVSKAANEGARKSAWYGSRRSVR